MRRFFGLFLVVAMLMVTATTALADKPVAFDPEGNEVGWKQTGCATIQDGTITDSNGNVITTGFDQFGYNYQAHLFNGTYDSSDRQWNNGYWGDTTSYYVYDSLEMKWSDDWLSNVDCNGDHKLDRGLVGEYVGGISLGWTTNHVQGTYTDETGEHHYTDFVKIVYVGPGGSLWGYYEIVEEVFNDPAGGYHGLFSKTDPGLGR